MKILVAGDWHSELHEQAVYKAFIELGHEVLRFSWHQYFSNNGNKTVSVISTLIKKFQNKFIFGPLVRRLNRDFMSIVDESRPALIFVYRGTHIYPETLALVKKRYSATVLAGYNNDDPFAENQSRMLWRYFISGIPEYDMTFVYRHHNIDDFIRAGAKKVKLLRSWYMPDRNYPVQLTSEENKYYGCDVAFIGHYEQDGRLEMLEEIVRHGYTLKLYGPGYEWDAIVAKSSLLSDQVPVKLVWGDQYNKAICGAKIALCFFSKLNKDTYTRRCFEIPATGTMMLSEYSDDLASLYTEGKEAEFFRNKEEMINKVKCYMNDNKLRNSVAEAGNERVVNDGHDVVSRMKYVLSRVENLKATVGNV